MERERTFLTAGPGPLFPRSCQRLFSSHRGLDVETVDEALGRVIYRLVQVNVVDAEHLLRLGPIKDVGVRVDLIALRGVSLGERLAVREVLRECLSLVSVPSAVVV